MANRNVQTTKDYNKFKILKGNRPVDETRVKSLMKLMESHGNRTDVMPVIINKEGYIIDGQHRLEALANLGWEVGYVVQEASLDTVRVINQGGRNWDWRDIASSYADMGDENYKTFLWFTDNYGLSYTASLVLISAISGAERGKLRRRYINGQLEVISREDATILGNQATEILEIAGEDKNSEFHKAMVRIIKSPAYDHERMVRKLKQLGHNLNLRDTASNYMRMLEDMFNQGLTNENKVRLF